MKRLTSHFTLTRYAVALLGVVLLAGGAAQSCRATGGCWRASERRYDSGEAGDGGIFFGAVGAAACVDAAGGGCEAITGGGDASGAARESCGLPHLRNARCRERCADDEGHHFSRVFDDEAGDWRGDDAALRARQVAAVGSDREIHSGICAFESVQRSGRLRET